MKKNSKRKRIVLLQNGETLKNKLKHLLIIFISLLLLSSPVFGDNHKGETLYGWGKALPYVWKGFGDKKLTQCIMVELRMEFQVVLVF